MAKRGKRCSSGRPGGKAVRLCGLLNGAKGHGGEDVLSVEASSTLRRGAEGQRVIWEVSSPPCSSSSDAAKQGKLATSENPGLVGAGDRHLMQQRGRNRRGPERRSKRQTEIEQPEGGGVGGLSANRHGQSARASCEAGTHVWRPAVLFRAGPRVSFCAGGPILTGHGLDPRTWREESRTGLAGAPHTVTHPASFAVSSSGCPWVANTQTSASRNLH